MDPPNAGLQVKCATPDGAAADARFSVLWIGRGRPGLRVGYAWANQPTAAVDYAPDPAYAFNSAGGPIFSRQLATGQYRVVFGGLARPAGAKETVLVVPFGGPDRSCSIVGWATTAVNDLSVTLSCFDPAGAPANTTFAVLVIQ